MKINSEQIIHKHPKVLNILNSSFKNKTPHNKETIGSNKQKILAFVLPKYWIPFCKKITAKNEEDNAIIINKT